MKLIVAVIGMMFCMAFAVPVPEPEEESIDLVKVPLSGNKELDILTLAESDGSINDRNKRTIGILRELFPQLSKLVEQKLQMLIQFAIRTFGPILLRGGLGGGGGMSTTNTASRNDADDFDDFDDDDNEVDDKDKSKVSISLPTFAPDAPEPSSTKAVVALGDNDDDNETLGSPARLDLFDSFDDDNSSSTKASLRAVEDENVLEPSGAGSDAISEFIRTARETTNLNSNENNKVTAEETPKAAEKTQDQQAAPSENSSAATDELTLDSLEDEENRGKRFLDLGGSSGSGQASGGGSGNFLFDIIRLVSGSSGTEQTDEHSNGADTDVGKGDGYTEGIPGPVTRLFVLANRGLSNLIQDLILRIAQTSERVVNFKARLITSLI